MTRYDYPPIDEPLEPERYELREGPAYRFDLDRREFVQILGAGLVISLSGNVSLAQQRSRRGRRRRSRGPRTVDQRLHISEQGVITVLTSKVEVGQGSRTQLTQAVAEELRVPTDQIHLIMADSALVPNDGGTAGSRTTPSTVPSVRLGAATAREVLIDLAAKRLDVDRARLEARDGRVVDPSSNRSVTYGELVQMKDPADAFGRLVGGEDVALTPVDQWQILGTTVARVGARDVVTGAHRYPSDIVRPKMFYGKVLRPASFGATLTSIDLAPARAMENVTVVRDGDFIGCAAETSDRAAEAVKAIAATAKWERPPHPDGEKLFEHLKTHAQPRAEDTDSQGSVRTALASATTVLREDYTVAYIAHAPMEPRAAVAEWNDGKLMVWTGTQQPQRVRGQLTEAFGLDEAQVRVIVPDTGGGFGGKHTGEVAVEAARLAREARRPVRVTWTREEEFTWAYFRPAGLIEVEAGVDAQGNITAWDFANTNSGGSAIESPYRIPNTRVRFIGTDSPLREGSYRALASTANTFARESAMDELATAAGVDPLAFRLAHLEPGRLRDVLEKAAERFGWERRRTPSAENRGVSLACGTEKGSYVAACVEVEVDRQRGRIRVLEICEAFECGAIHNPDNLRAQVEGCILMGLGGALSEEIKFKKGKILNPKFSRYRVPRLADVPKLDTVLVNRLDLPSVGAGETPIIAVAPAVAGAVFQATGLRIRSMPLEASLATIANNQ